MITEHGWEPIGSNQCVGQALKYHKNFIDALNYAIEEMKGSKE